MIQPTLSDAEEQMKAALLFLDMARNENNSKKDRKNYILFAFMHAAQASVIADIADTAGVVDFGYHDIKHHIKDGCSALMHGISLARAVEIINRVNSPHETPVYTHVDQLVKS